jgi:tripartite-type tricarboxylate transporter receptor subunit TctC
MVEGSWQRTLRPSDCDLSSSKSADGNAKFPAPPVKSAFTMVVWVSMDPPIPYDPQRDLAPISQLVRTRNLLAVQPKVPAATLTELVALAKARPGQLAYAHSVVGFSTHLGMELLKQAAGIDITAISYANEGPVLNELRQGRVHIVVSSGPAIMRQVQEGELRALAVTSSDRAPVLPDIPTIAESGFPGFVAVAWFGPIAPAGTSSTIITKVRDDAVASMTSSPMRERLEEYALVPVGSTPQEFTALIPAETARMRTVLEPLGLRAR